jgi:osmotically inducible lipoprotein OsmB
VLNSAYAPGTGLAASEVSTRKERLKMNTRFRWSGIATLVVLASLATGCTLGGAAAGGVIGNEATNHSAAGTIGGAVVGGAVGYELGK